MSAKDWRMLAKCETCPFHTKGPGLTLRKSLRRWRQITQSILAGAAFYCHKTAMADDEDGFIPDGKARYCAGAIEFEDKRGVSSNYRRMCERFDWIAANRRRKGTA
jgi:hypothetical protein